MMAGVLKQAPHLLLTRSDVKECAGLHVSPSPWMNELGGMRAMRSDRNAVAGAVREA